MSDWGLDSEMVDCMSCGTVSSLDEVSDRGGRCPVCGQYNHDLDAGRHHAAARKLHTAADPTLPPAFGEDTNVVHRMVGWDLPYVMRQRGHTPESIAQDLKRDPEGTAHSIFGSIEDNYGGIGHHFTRNPAMADYIADVKGDNHDFHVVFSGTHDPEDVNTDNDDLTGGEWPEEEETTLLPGSSVNIHQLKIRPSHSPDWTTVPMNRDSYTSWDRNHTASRRLHTAADEDYRDSHHAPGPEDGAPMHDVTQGIYPASFYDEPFRYWGTDESTGDRDSWGTIHKVRGNPDARVKVHRALPLDVAKRERGIGLAAPLNTGDWVTPSYNYAHEHGMSRLEGNTPWTVVTSTVPASQLHTDGNSLAEWGYNGPPTQGYEGANAAGKRKYRQQQVRKQQINAETTKDFHHCGFCGSPSGKPCERGCWGKKKYPGERDVRGDLPGQPGVSGGGEIDYDPDALRDIRLSHHTASTDGVRYAHLVEADVADDLMRMRLAGRPKRIKPPWSDFHAGQAYPLQNQNTADLVHMFYSLRDNIFKQRQQMQEQYRQRTAMPNERDVYDDFYDEDEYSPDERPDPHDGPWYHYSPSELPVGTHLTPGHASPWGDDLYAEGTGHRRDYVWLSPTVTDAAGWAEIAPRKGNTGRGHIYRVNPSSGVLPWNGTGSDGWVADGAHIVEELTYPWKEPHAREDFGSHDRDVAARQRTAAVNQELVDSLSTEFNQWWDENQKSQPGWMDVLSDHGIDPRDVNYSEGEFGSDDDWDDDLTPSWLKPMDPVTDKTERGPIGFWPHVESFLKDRYPAAYRNKLWGYEGVADLLDVPDLVRGDPYETGPEAIDRHGYDPREIASGMLLLHNRSDPLRGDLAEEDLDRLTDIFDKRQQMQRDYEQRTKTAMPWYHRTDDELNPGDHLLPYNQVHPDHQEVGDESWNPNKAYVYYGEEDDSSDHAPYAGYGQHIYEIEPHDDPQRDYGDGNHSSHMTDGGTVIKRLPDEDPYSFGEEPQWADPIAHKYASRTASCSDDEYMHGQCAAWAVAHQREYPHLRFGIDWQRLTPDHPDWDEEDEGDEIWQPQHIFTHDDTHAYDVRGAHPLSDIKQWDDVTLNHSRNDVLSTGMHEMGWEPESDVVRRVSPHTASRTAMPWSQYEQSRNARLAMAWDEWAPQVRNDFYQHVSPEGLGKLSRPCEVGGCGGGSSLGAYWIDHGEGKQSHLTFTHRPQEKRIDVNLLGTHEDFQGDGVAESLMRRLHEDHPGMTINPGSMTGQGRGFHDRMLEKEPDARNVVTAGKNGPPPPMTFEPFNTMWTNGIMARHAEDGRPLAHLHWYPDGEIETIRVHPQMRGRDIGKAILTHAASHPDTYEASDGIKPSNTLTPDGRAFARSMGHNPTDEEVTPAEGEDQWAWKAVNKYVPMHIPYNGQNEDEMSRYLDQPWTPPAKTASVDDEGWPVWWRGRHRMAGPFDKRWHPNHPEHITAPWDS